MKVQEQENNDEKPEFKEIWWVQEIKSTSFWRKAKLENWEGLPLGCGF